MLKSAISSVFKLVSPKFYVEQFNCVVNSTRKAFIAGSPAPLFKGMLLVGLVGYSMEYGMVGRHHVAEKQKIIKEAMAHHEHH